MPEVWERWAALEAEIGGRFLKRESYAAQLARVRLPVLPFEADDEDEAPPLPCDCTQLRAPRPTICTCGSRRGRGHALLCPLVLGDQPGVFYAGGQGGDGARIDSARLPREVAA